MGIFSEDIPEYPSSGGSITIPPYTGGGSGDPASMGGVPSVMPSNDWWKSAVDLAGRGLDTYAKIQASKNQTGIAVPAGRISSSPINPAPGSGGLFFQNAATPGARNAGALGAMSQQSMLIAAGLVVLVVMLMVRR